MARNKTQITKREQKQIDAVVNSHPDKLASVEWNAEAQTWIAHFAESLEIDSMESEDLDALLADALEAGAAALEEAGVEEELDDAEEGMHKTIVPVKYRNEYKARGDARVCGDWLSFKLRELLNASGKKGGVGPVDLDKTYALARANGCDKEWPHLNPGQQRMNAGNAIRRNFIKTNALVVPASVSPTGEELILTP
jgi:hypothetical protein